MSVTKRGLMTLIVVALVLIACGGKQPEPGDAPIAVSEGQETMREVTGTEAEEALTEPVVEEAEQVEVTRVAVEPVATQAPPGYEGEVAPAPTPPPDNFFRDYGVNPYVDANVDNLSTFSLDVDTGAYTVARRYVRDGIMPPAEAVRVEEFVNYFDQGYAAPPDVAFAIYADGAPSPFHNDGSYILRVGVQGYDVPQAQRLPANLTFVVDVSGSMARESRLELVKGALQMLLDGLRSDDTVSLVVYGSNARVILEPTAASERDRILSAIYSLQPEGSTNAEAGLRLGYQMANSAYRSEGINRVILASDGVANVGLTDPDGLAAEIRRLADGGIQLTTIGVGMGNFNDVLMEQLADQGDGHYAYVDTMSEAHRVFVEELTGTLQVIALDAKVQVDFNPQVVRQYRLIGYENRAVADQDFRNDAVDAGEIGAGHTATALYAVQLHDGATGRLGTVQLRWRDPQTGQVQEINGNVNTWDLSASFEESDAHYQLAVVVAQYAELLRNSYWAGDATYAELAARAGNLSARLSGDEKVTEFNSLVQQTVSLRR
ncbi:MAG: vWA domain-containing protein [Chloroflexota bacterium]